MGAVSDILNSAKRHDWYAHDETLAGLADDAAEENERLRGLLRDLGVCVDWYIVSDDLKRRVHEALGE
jgi:hypothetical protein